MRKLWYAGAVVASGFVLFAAGPAQADVQPGPTDADLLTQMPMLSGALPNGQQQQSFDPLTGAHSEGMPLLGGVDGGPPVNGLPTVPSDGPSDAAGLPGGGIAVLAPAVTATTDPSATPTGSVVTPAATGSPAATTPAKHKHKVKPTASATIAPATTAPATIAPATTAPSADPADPRLHEEPIDGEATRTFSAGGRPVAGIDQQYR